VREKTMATQPKNRLESVRILGICFIRFLKLLPLSIGKYTG